MTASRASSESRTRHGESESETESGAMIDASLSPNMCSWTSSMDAL